MESQLSLNLDGLFTPKKEFKEKAERPYHIEMVNSYLNSLGHVYKRQELRSTYTRIIDKVYEDTVSLNSYRWEKLTFTNRVPKMPVTPLDWTFAQGRFFHSHLVLSHEKLEELCRKGDVSDNDYQKCFQSIEDSYAQLPKLPATFLLIMQTLDVLAFECYMSYVHTYAAINTGWKLDEWVTIVPLERTYTDAAQISFGLYAENSTFKNGKFYIKLTGYGKANNKTCAIFDYYCDNSRVKMQEKERSHIQRNGTSYYHGQIWIGLDNGDVERGTMLESYIALQEGDQKTPVHIRRKILCESVSDPQQ